MKFQTTMKPPPKQKRNDPSRRLTTEMHPCDLQPFLSSDATNATNKPVQKVDKEESSGWSSRAAGLETTVNPLLPDMEGGHVMM